MFLNGYPESEAVTWQPDAGDDVEQWTLLTRVDQDTQQVQERPQRPVLLVTSTSWTADEDFGLLLKAVQIYDTRAQKNHSLPALALVITGKGPLKEQYEQEIRTLCLKRVRIATAWLAIEDYPLLLGESLQMGQQTTQHRVNLHWPFCRRS
jgi:hypothetical protein